VSATRRLVVRTARARAVLDELTDAVAAVGPVAPWNEVLADPAVVADGFVRAAVTVAIGQGSEPPDADDGPAIPGPRFRQLLRFARTTWADLLKEPISGLVLVRRPELGAIDWQSRFRLWRVAIARTEFRRLWQEASEGER
jgi:hypothetical protein